MIGGLRPAVLLLLVSGAATGVAQQREATAVFAGGCFWGVESVFEHVRGVKSATAGYSGGSTASPSHVQMETGTTGHAESVRVAYDPSVVSYRQLLAVFFLVAHDPTMRDRQGPDAGPQYRAIVFYQDSTQHSEAQAYIAELTEHHVFSRPIVTEVRPFHAFYPAEAYHQHYAAQHPTEPYIEMYDVPRVERLRRLFPAFYVDGEGN